jgi:hypothetical protein
MGIITGRDLDFVTDMTMKVSNVMSTKVSISFIEYVYILMWLCIYFVCIRMHTLSFSHRL